MDTQLTFELFDIPKTKPVSRYVRTTWMLSANKMELTLPDSSRIRFFSESESHRLAEMMRKKNVFVRHSREQGFYWQRVKALANNTVIEVSFDGYPKEAGEKIRKVADLLEMLSVLSVSLVLRRNELQKKLGISLSLRNCVDFSWENNFQYFSSKLRSAPPAPGISIDKRFCKRFSRSGFNKLYEYCLLDNSLTKRVFLSLSWLFEAIKEPNLNASIVKTSITLESLLIFNESEALAKSLSERTAFILSVSPSIRHKISQIIKRFYEVRSGIVHGSRKKLKKLTPELVESVNRLCILCCLTIASNSDKWSETKDLINWFENERWNIPTADIQPTYIQRYLKNALNLVDL